MNEEFEKWVRGKYPDAWLHRLAGSTDYMVPSMQYMWEAWQASRKQAVEEAANECEKLAAQNDEDMAFENDERFGVYAKKYRKAAYAIRKLQKA